MKYILILLLISGVSLIAKDTQKENKALQRAIEAEEKIAQEQTFHKGSDYDLKSQEADTSSLNNLDGKSLGELINAANEDFDMDDVY